MSGRFSRTHAIICFIAWGLWTIGCVIMLISSAVFNNDNDILFSVAHNYNLIVALISLLPIEPIVFILDLRDNLKNKRPRKNVILSVILFSLNICLLFTYISLFVELTGGV